MPGLPAEEGTTEEVEPGIFITKDIETGENMHVITGDLKFYTESDIKRMKKSIKNIDIVFFI